MALGMLCADEGPNFWFFNSWDQLRSFDRDHGGNHIVDSIKIMSGPRIVDTRSEMADTFLRDTQADYLLTIDADMAFDPNVVDRMLDTIYEAGRQGIDIKVLGGLCFAGGTEDTRMYPTIYKADTELDFFAPQPVCSLGRDPETGHHTFKGIPYPRDALVKVQATGTAFLLIHREVLMRLAAPHPRGFGSDQEGNPNPYPWFADTHQWGRSYGEDIVFCQRAQAVGYDVWVDTRIKIDHYKYGALLAERTWDLRLNGLFGVEGAEKYRAQPKELALP